MTSKAFALSREELIRTLTAYSGITTADGAGDGTTLIDSNLIGRNDFVSEKTILILSGDAQDEDEGAASFDNVTGEITLQGTGVSAQIVQGTIYRVLNISTTEVDVAAIAANLGVMAAAATSDDMSDILTTPALAKLRLILNRLSPDAFTAFIRGGARTALDTMLAEMAKYFVADGGIFDLKINNGVNRDNLNLILRDYFDVIGIMNTSRFAPHVYGGEKTTLVSALSSASLYWAPLDELLDIKMQNGTNKNSFKEVFKDYLSIVGCLNTARFAPRIFGAERTSFMAAFHALPLYWAPLDELLDIKINNGTNKNDLKNILKDFFTMIGCLDTNVFNPIIGGTPRTTFDAAFAAIGTALAALVGAAGLFHEQADVPLTFNTVNGAETNVLNLVAASTRYIVRSLRLKFADPGAETITVRLYELVNDVLTEVDNFEVTTANFGTYHSLMDMFGMAQLAGDNLKVTTRVSAGADIATLGQYSHAKTNV